MVPVRGVQRCGSRRVRVVNADELRVTARQGRVSGFAAAEAQHVAAVMADESRRLVDHLLQHGAQPPAVHGLVDRCIGTDFWRCIRDNLSHY